MSPPLAAELAAELAAIAADSGFSGAVRVSIEGEPPVELARGLADRARGRANAVDTRFATASGTKLLTALAAGSLIDDGLLALDDRLVELAGAPLPGVDPRVTVDHLLTHTSGVYDYYDEDAITDFDSFELPVDPRQLAEVSDYLPMLTAGPAKFAPGERFSYSNGGYVLLGLAIEARGGAGYHQLVRERVLEPAGMADSGFFRFDSLPPRVALGYTGGPDSAVTNDDRLPIIGGPDGGAYVTTGDAERLWRALLSGAIISSALFERFTDPVSHHRGDVHYGRGLWMRRFDGRTEALYVTGADAGVSYTSTCHGPGVIATVASNTSDGAWPVSRAINALIAERVDAGRRGFGENRRGTVIEP